MPFRGRAAGQGDQVGFTPVVQLAGPVDLGAVLQDPSQPILAEERRRLGRAPSGEALDVALSTVYRVKQRFAEAGLSKFCRTVPRPTGPGSWTTGAEAHPVSGTGQALIALACSPAPEGHAHWTLRLLAGKVVELGLASPCPMRESESV